MFRRFLRFGFGFSCQSALSQSVLICPCCSCFPTCLQKERRLTFFASGGQRLPWGVGTEAKGQFIVMPAASVAFVTHVAVPRGC